MWELSDRWYFACGEELSGCTFEQCVFPKSWEEVEKGVLSGWETGGRKLP